MKFYFDGFFAGFLIMSAVVIFLNILSAIFY